MLRICLLGLLVVGCSVVGTEEERANGATTDASAEPERVPTAELDLSPSNEPTLPSPASPETPPGPQCPDGFRCAFERFGEKTRISEVRVHKRAHRMLLLSEDVVVRQYSVALGYGGLGPKKREGDGVTPTGTYRMTGKLAKSPWHTLIGVSYPNYDDVLRHASLKASREIPHDAGIGFGIAVHGRSANQADGEHKNSDWTLGCIALDNDEIDEFSRVVPKGTPIIIED